MLTRREFLFTTAAGVAASRAQADPFAADAFAADPDLLIARGRVIDPSQRIDCVADVAVRGGRIVAVKTNIAVSGSVETIDASGKLVVPGLIDIHMHAADPALTPARCLRTGVTTLVDGGSRGADNIEDLVGIAGSAPNRVRVLLNLARRGNDPAGELLNLDNADVGAARRAIERHRDLVVGVKARMSRNLAGDHDLEAVRRARDVAAPFGLPVMLHVGDSVSPLPAIVALLKRGDIVTHVYASPPHGILDDRGVVLPEIREARRRGVLFDVGYGRTGHITWAVAQRALEQDFLPDTISTDLTAAGLTDRVFDFPTVLSNFLVLGLTLEQVIARATINAARAIKPFNQLGTLKVGAPADVTVLELREGDFDFVDNDNTKRTGRQKLVPYAVVAGGKRFR
jgi:dihydroorotase